MQTQRTLIVLEFCALVALAVAALGAPETAVGSHNSGLGFTVEPSAPTELDPITITVEGTMANPCHDGSSRGHTLSGDTISIYIESVKVGDGCALFLRGYTVAEEIGQLPAGPYQVRVIVLVCSEFPDCYPADSASGAFQVLGAVGGIAELPDLESAPLETPGTSGTNTAKLARITSAATAAAIVLGGAAWYTRRRVRR